MFRVHLFVDNELMLRPMLKHCPRINDTLRLSDTQYVKVTEVIWCLDEPSGSYDRINLRTISIST